MSTSTSASLSGESPRAASRAPAVLLWSGTVVAGVSGLALVAILVMYFLQNQPHPAVYAVGLWGLPLGFVLMLAHLMLSAGRRRRGLG
ncbi:cell division protein CrgA [Nesterenkonia halotolerans]|uniref:Integral membrane protein n=1 Tax=Nesterenkonia halotolerans TaxID=225325 RepID=A0ABR9J8H1_9MICC|nr:cell division protein CrgA [Nesterenkonia halotolerans]MBE1515303.1 putative integral membrane protein [Nesterenkonia halotolerans]